MQPADFTPERDRRRRGAVRAALAVPQERARPRLPARAPTGPRSPSPGAPTSASRASSTRWSGGAGLPAPPTRRAARRSSTSSRRRACALYLVDMPGYGFAEAPKAKVEAWTRLVKAYLRGRPTLLRVFLLIDARHGLKTRRPRPDGADGRGGRLLPGACSPRPTRSSRSIWPRWWRRRTPSSRSTRPPSRASFATSAQDRRRHPRAAGRDRRPRRRAWRVQRGSDLSPLRVQKHTKACGEGSDPRLPSGASLGGT